MDPTIMKLLEEDEDETMHSGAAVDALQAALNRDIGGDTSSTPQPSISGVDSIIRLFRSSDTLLFHLCMSSCYLRKVCGVTVLALEKYQKVEVLSHGSNQTSNQQFMNWEATGLQAINEGSVKPDMESIQNSVQQVQHTLPMEIKNHDSSSQVTEQSNHSSQEFVSPIEQQQQPLDVSGQTSGMNISEIETATVSGSDKIQNAGELPTAKMQKTPQKLSSAEQPGNLKNPGKQIPFVLLLPALKPHLDKDREMQLQTLFHKLRKNDIAKDQFVRMMRNIVGEQVLRLAVSQMQMQQGSNQVLSQSQASGRQHVRTPNSGSTSVAIDSRSFDTSQSHTSLSLPPGSDSQKPIEVERPVDVQGKHPQINSSISALPKQEDHLTNTVQSQNKQQQSHFQYPHSSFSMYGSTSGSYQVYTGTNVSSSLAPVKPQSVIPQHQTLSATQTGGPSQVMNMTKLERPSHVNDPNKMQSSPASYHTAKPTGQPSSVIWQAPINAEKSSSSLPSINYVKKETIEQPAEPKQKAKLLTSQGLYMPSGDLGNLKPANLKDEQSDNHSTKVGFSSLTGVLPGVSVIPVPSPADSNAQVSRIPSVPGSSGKTPPKKNPVGHKKPLETLGSPPPSSKKQKVSGGLLDQSIEQLNDVTAVSGVNLIEEEEQLFSVPKEDSRVTEASRRMVQEEEDRLILERVPLRKKLAEIMVKFGLKNTSADVERCLSLCLEERIRGLLCNLIRLSKQRVDIEKTRHRTVITSDVRQQILIMNRKAKEEWERKQAEAEKLRKSNEPEGDSKMEGDKDKDEGRAKSIKVNKEEDDKMRTNAANVAARAAVGVDDMLSKWQLMAQARQKREGSSDATSGSQSDNMKSKSSAGRSAKDHLDEKRRSGGASSGARRFGKNQGVSHSKVSRTISIKDIIAVLERESQMSKSTLMYRLYERIQPDAPVE